MKQKVQRFVIPIDSCTVRYDSATNEKKIPVRLSAFLERLRGQCEQKNRIFNSRCRSLRTCKQNEFDIEYLQYSFP